MKKYCLPLPSGARLIIEAEDKLEAVSILEDMGHLIGCGDIRAVKGDVSDMDVEDINVRLMNEGNKKRHSSEP